ncbi:hypothetical protein ACFLU0_00915 [Chloroflexota bacterium]
MRIIAWFRERGLQRRKRSQARRLSEIRANLQKLRAREPRMRSMIQAELMRIRQLKKQLDKVKSEEELRFWLSLFNMCIPLFKVLLGASQSHAKTRKLKRGDQK